jgi:two-component system OmpR family sensor kinase
VEQLLALARQEARPQTEDAPLADLRVLVEQALADAAPAAQAKGLDMGLSEDPQQQSAFSVAADAEALAVLLRNLLDNAIKYVPAGGVLMWAGCRTSTDVHWWWKTRVLALHRPSVSASCSALCEVRGWWHGRRQWPGTGHCAKHCAKQGAQLLLDESPQLGGLRVRVLWPQS